MRCLLAILGLLVLTTPARADVWEPSPEAHPWDEPAAPPPPPQAAEPERPYVRPATPRLSPLRIAGEVLVGGAVGFAVAVPALAISSRTGSDLATGISVYGALAVGSTIGVGLIGNLGDEAGSHSAAFAGAAVGLIPGLIATIDVARHGGYNNLPPGGIILCGLAGLVTPTLGAVVGFNLSTRWDSDVRVVPTAMSDGSTTMFGLGGSF